MIRLADLILNAMPREVSSGHYARWDVLAPALLGNAAMTLKTVMDLQPPRYLQAQMLARVLAEHSILFAWLAIHPTKHVALWNDDSLARRSVAVSERRKLARRDFYKDHPGARAALLWKDWSAEDEETEMSNLAQGRLVHEERKAKKRPTYPSIVQKALEADKAWLGKLGEYGLSSFAAVYLTSYDRGHDATHARAGLIFSMCLERTAGGKAGSRLPSSDPPEADLPYKTAADSFRDMALVAFFQLPWVVPQWLAEAADVEVGATAGKPFAPGMGS